MQFSGDADPIGTRFRANRSAADKWRASRFEFHGRLG
jgi:hypothetical protein